MSRLLARVNERLDEIEAGPGLEESGGGRHARGAVTGGGSMAA